MRSLRQLRPTGRLETLNGKYGVGSDRTLRGRDRVGESGRNAARSNSPQLEHAHDSNDEFGYDKITCLLRVRGCRRPGWLIRLQCQVESFSSALVEAEPSTSRFRARSDLWLGQRRPGRVEIWSSSIPRCHTVVAPLPRTSFLPKATVPQSRSAWRPDDGIGNLNKLNRCRHRSSSAAAPLPPQPPVPRLHRFRDRPHWRHGRLRQPQYLCPAHHGEDTSPPCSTPIDVVLECRC